MAWFGSFYIIILIDRRDKLPYIHRHDERYFSENNNKKIIHFFDILIIFTRFKYMLGDLIKSSSNNFN